MSKYTQLAMFTETDPERLITVIYYDHPYREDGSKDYTRKTTWIEYKPRHVVDDYIKYGMITRNYKITE